MMATHMEGARRRSIPVSLIVWLPILAVVFGLNSARPNAGDPRWSPQWWHAYYPDGEGMFYAWVLPALGIVWTFALLLRLPPGERIGRRRMFWAWMKAGLGMSIVLRRLGLFVSDFNAADVGSVNAVLTWLGLVFFMAIVSVAILRLRRSRPSVSPRVAGSIGSAAVLVMGFGLYRADLPDDPVRGLHGAARAQALLAHFDDYKGEATLAIERRERAAGVGYKRFASGDRVDFEVAVPWPEGGAQRSDQIVQFWSHPSPALSDIPRPPWHAEWRAGTSATDPPALLFAIRQAAESWTVYTLGSASREAANLAQAPWDDLRPLTTTLVDAHYMPPAANPGPQQSRDIIQVTLLRLAFQLDRLARACNTPSAREISGAPASEVLGATASRARDLRAVIMHGGSLPAQALMSFADQVAQLGVNNQWRRRADGCAAVEVTEEYAFSNISDDIRKNAEVAR
jgi:hypothetical protein